MRSTASMRRSKTKFVVIDDAEQPTAVRRPGPAQHIDELKAAGYEVIGDGHFAVALAHPKAPGIALKVSCYSRRDRGDGWLEYVKAFAGTRSKHFPVISSIVMYPTYYVAEMERLIPLEDVPSLADVIQVAGRYSYDPSKHAGSLGRFCARMMKNVSGYFDCHEANFMARADGTVVLTDPVT